MIKIILCGFALLLLSCATGYVRSDIDEISCYPELPSPELTVKRAEDYSANNRDWTRYRIKVKNSSNFPDELFMSASHLPPCGINYNSSRTWISILDNTDTKIYGFCALGRARSLNDMWFALPVGEIPPESVYITMKDRECDRVYKSNLAPVE
jgi:hypothetical protein